MRLLFIQNDFQCLQSTYRRMLGGTDVDDCWGSAADPEMKIQWCGSEKSFFSPLYTVPTVYSTA